jgi:hypothetical protein
MFIKFLHLREKLINYYIIFIFFRNNLIIITAHNTYILIYIMFHNDFCPVNS